jgi:GNAT superfamily N-acetyltransferase
VSASKTEESGLVFRPVTAAEWPDMQQLFSENPFRGCWCMYWRSKRREFDQQYGEDNRLAMERLIHSGKVPGILAYLDGHPVGWCSVAPREDFAALERSRTLRRVDDLPVWSIVCLLVARDQRGQGLSQALIQGAIEYARSRGAQIVEAYPLIPERSKDPARSSYMGMVSTFREVGFREVAQAGKMRVVMRYGITDQV